MKTTKKITIGLFLFAIFSSLTIITNANTKVIADKAPESTIVEIAIADERFSILVEAVSKAGLVDALSAEGPYTVFAPTNDAFEALFADLDVKGVEDLSAEQLKPILLYHVLSGEVMSSDVKTGKVETLNESAWMSIEANKKGVSIDDNAKVIIADVQGSNGVIHVIDKVLIPETKTTKSSGGCN